jgi:AhpD family alkylhydroperoxidase
MMSIDERTKILIAVGASISANCQPCLDYHLERARKAGLDNPDIAEAIETGRSVRTGAASGMDRKISSIDKSAAVPRKAGACCC